MKNATTAPMLYSASNVEVLGTYLGCVPTTTDNQHKIEEPVEGVTHVETGVVAAEVALVVGDHGTTMFMM